MDAPSCTSTRTLLVLCCVSNAPTTLNVALLMLSRPREHVAVELEGGVGGCPGGLPHEPVVLVEGETGAKEHIGDLLTGSKPLEGGRMAAAAGAGHGEEGEEGEDEIMLGDVRQ